MPRILLLIAILGIALAACGYRNALADPVVRHARVALPGWPQGAPPIRVVLLTDIHVAGPDMPPSRLSRIVDRVNALSPDMVLIAGDLVSDKRLSTRHYGIAEAVAPLGRLQSSHGTVAVLGNHDHWRDGPAFTQALRGEGITVLANEAIGLGPLAILGIDDAFTDRDDVAATLTSARRLEGARVALSHSPDVTPHLRADVPLVLAGHTHCGQIAPPVIGRSATMSRYGDRYACGPVREGTGWW